MNSPLTSEHEVLSESERWLSEGEGSPMVSSPNSINRPIGRRRINVAGMFSGSMDRNIFLSYFLFIFSCVKLTLSIFLISFRPIGCKFSGSYRCLLLMIINDVIQIIIFGWEVLPIGWQVWKLEGDKNFLYNKEKTEELDKILQTKTRNKNRIIYWMKIGNIIFFWIIFFFGNIEFWSRKSTEFDACEENIQAMMVVLMVFGSCVVFVLLFVFFVILMAVPLILLVTFFAKNSQNERETKIRDWPSKKFKSDEVRGQKICSICMDEYKTDDDLIQLNCHEMHHFHAICLKSWLVRNVTCPCCRQKIL